MVRDGGDWSGMVRNGEGGVRGDGARVRNGREW